MEAHELNKKLKSSLEILANETNEAKVSQQMIDFFDFASKFHQYSANNQWLIFSTMPDATRVAGYTTWRTMGRYVKKGEKGIPIFAPHFWEDEDEHGLPVKRIGFHVVHVFDVSQTEGEELPETPKWKSPERLETLSNALMDFCADHNIEVEIKELTGETQGASAKGKIYLSPDAGTKTFVHEIAHELMHWEDCDIPGNIKELEAESVGYVVAKHFGITDLSSPNYIALHRNKPDEILNRMDRIMDVARLIITYVEKEDEENDQTINKTAKVYA
ncbi:MAG: ArdC family protein [Kosmotogaceae bacterium]